jgi:hypothetical protein
VAWGEAVAGRGRVAAPRQVAGHRERAGRGQESRGFRHPGRRAICASIGPAGGGMSAICMRSATNAAL